MVFHGTKNLGQLIWAPEIPSARFFTNRVPLKDIYIYILYIVFFVFVFCFLFLLHNVIYLINTQS